ncbi:Retrovirus Pol polyprotein from transposon 17.6 [Fasciola hepatica]|uniref:Retrovirus Pol polyprotein from transposon 17.6 n=1 Tax=Fasciola hepatica TaxID=6192 RepID=A0A4E0RBJ1_FASHE|nr:Retrovirus Pol polyprotein from transposon 17.6 [Fasciola hepatica]
MGPVEQVLIPNRRREPPYPVPDKLSLGDDASVWEAQTKRYIHRFPADEQVDLILTLLSKEVFIKLLDHGVPQDVNSLFALLRQIADSPVAEVDRQNEFYVRTQAEGERLVEYLSVLRRLARLRFPEEAREDRESRILSRFLAGVRDPMAKVFLRLQPPKDLATLESTSTTLDQTGGGMNVTTPGIFAVLARTGRQPAVREVKVCYHCQKPGHIARYCRRRINREGRSTFHAGNINSFEYDKRSGALPVIEIIIGRHQVRALIDSGSVYSLISEQLASKVPRCPLYDRPVSLKSVTGTPLEAVDSITTELQLGVHNYLQGFTVVRNLPVPVILGVDFLRSTRCTLNFRDNWLQTEGNDTRIKTQTAFVTFMTDLEEESISGQRIGQLLPSKVEGLEPSDRGQFERLLREYERIFSWDGEQLGRTNLVQHSIDTGDARPVRQASRRVSVHCQDSLREAIEKMLKQEVIRPSTPWASPVVLVKKKEGSMRVCVDYRKLNSVTRKDSFPLPRIDDTLDGLAGSQWFSTLDLASGYWQVEVKPEDREKTAFVIPSGLYEFDTMPFGLTNTPATFQRLVQVVLAGLPLNTCLFYLDDTIIPGKSFQEHLDNLKLVFQKLESAGLRLNPKKCVFLKGTVKFLVHTLSRAGISSDPEKIHAVEYWPIPRDVDEVRGFLGLASYYRRFVPEFSAVATPLTELTKKASRLIGQKAARERSVNSKEESAVPLF